MNPSTKTTTLIGILIALIIVAGLLLALSQTAKEQRALSVTSFEECKAAGYPIMESYPEQCVTPDGRMYINDARTAPLIDASASTSAQTPGTSSPPANPGAVQPQL